MPTQFRQAKAMRPGLKSDRPKPASPLKLLLRLQGTSISTSSRETCNQQEQMSYTS